MRFRFTLRELFWVTLIVALAVGWWLDWLRRPRQEYYERWMDNRQRAVYGLTARLKMATTLLAERGFSQEEIEEQTVNGQSRWAMFSRVQRETDAAAEAE